MSPEDTPEDPAPAVVAVVITRDPGDHLEDTLRSLRDQDYHHLSTLVVDVASRDLPLETIGRILPDAYVRRLGEVTTLASAANEVADVVSGAAYFLFLHDDAVLDPSSVSTLVAEAVRHNAGVVGAKVVEWADPSRLVSVGMSTDRSGHPSPLVDEGELDQAQHDRVRDVMYVPGVAMLVRADLFDVLGGFDAAIAASGTDRDLCWRARLAGARVIVAPDARVRTPLSLPGRFGGDARSEQRARLRTLLVTASRTGLVLVLGQIVLGAIWASAGLVARGRFREVRGPFEAFRWNLASERDLRGARMRMRASQQIRQREVRRLQLARGARVRARLASLVGPGDKSASPTDVDLGFESSISGERQAAVLLMVLLAAMLVLGGRHLVTRGVPMVGQFAPVPPIGDLIGEFLSGYRRGGLGEAGSPPTAYGLFALMAVPFAGAVALARTILLLALVPLGWMGAWRMMAAPGSNRARIAAVVVYAAVPLPYNAYASGDLAGLIGYALMPFVVTSLARRSRTAPWSGSSRTSAWRADVLGLGLVVFLAAAFAPVLVLVPLGVAAGLMLGGMAVGRPGGSRHMIGAGLAAAATAVLLHVPWSLEYLDSGGWSALTGSGRADGTGTLDILRFHTGPSGSWLGLGLVVAALIPLLFGRSWRLEWAGRAWGLIATGWILAWLAAQDYGGSVLPGPQVSLTLSGVGVALAAGLGVVAYEADLPRFRFGWRQGLAVVSAGWILLSLVPIVGDSFNGRWNLPKADFRRTLGFFEEDARSGGFRVLWVGDPDVVPSGTFDLGGGVGYSLSRNGTPDLRDLWPGPPDEDTELVAGAIRRARNGDSDRLGRLLAPFGIRYVVVVDAAAPSFTSATVRPGAPLVSAALARQVDLARVEIDESLAVYENTRWTPVPAILTDESVAAVRLGALDDGFGQRVEGGTPVLADPDRWPGESVEGDVPAGVLYLAEDDAERWKLRTTSGTVRGAEAFGFATVFSVPVSGPATLSYEPPPLRYVAVGIQMALVALVVAGQRNARADERNRNG